VAFEPGIVIFPPGPGAAPSSKESSCPLSLTFITLPAAVLLVVLTSLLATLPDDVTPVVARVGELTFVLVVPVALVPLVVDRVGDLTFALAVPLVAARIRGGSSNAGALASG
jgi:hypothetical protein